MNASVCCRTTINYRHKDTYEPCQVSILDAREARDLAWQSSGFELIRHESAIRDWTDRQEIEACHYKEIDALAGSISGCDQVLYFPALIRSPSAAREHLDYAPILLAHSDYAESYGKMVTTLDHPYQQTLSWSREQTGIGIADLAAARRLLVLQFWRNTGSPEPDCPLAICDTRSTSRDQLSSLLVTEYGGVRTEFEALLPEAEFAGVHNWYTYPCMNRDEVLLMRTYDSEAVGERQAFWTLHSAFRHPLRHGAPARQSIEMRAICIFH